MVRVPVPARVAPTLIRNDKSQNRDKHDERRMRAHRVIVSRGLNLIIGAAETAEISSRAGPLIKYRDATLMALCAYTSRGSLANQNRNWPGGVSLSILLGVRYNLQALPGVNYAKARVRDAIDRVLRIFLVYFRRTEKRWNIIGNR